MPLFAICKRVGDVFPHSCGSQLNWVPVKSPTLHKVTYSMLPTLPLAGTSTDVMIITTCLQGVHRAHLQCQRHKHRQCTPRVHLVRSGDNAPPTQCWLPPITYLTAPISGPWGMPLCAFQWQRSTLHSTRLHRCNHLQGNEVTTDRHTKDSAMEQLKLF